MSGIEWATLIIAAIGGITGLGSLWFTYLQWQKIKAKVTMIGNSSLAFEVLPAWYTGRMMNDEWIFGLLTTDGRLLVIHRVVSVSSDGKWMDVELFEKTDFSLDLTEYGIPVFAVASDRTSASVQISTIVAAMDLQTS
jgi:hypothetical protein